jgi:hypothetical protein
MFLSYLEMEEEQIRKFNVIHRFTSDADFTNWFAGEQENWTR